MTENNASQHCGSRRESVPAAVAAGVRVYVLSCCTHNLRRLQASPALLSPVPFIRPHPAANAADTALAKLYNDYRGKWTGWSPRLAGEESPNSAEQCAG